MKSADSHRKWWIIGIIFVILFLCVSAVGYYFWQKMQRMHTTEIAPEEIQMNEMAEEDKASMHGYTSIAIFGVDNRSNGTYTGGNSDTIIIANIHHDTKDVKLVSLYRDTYLRLNSEGTYGKANAAFAMGGPAQGMSMINTNLDLSIQKYVAVDWYALVHAIDLLGGVTIDITEAERAKINEYSGEVSQVTGKKTSAVTQSGSVTLDGVQATAFARIRKLAGDDYKRTMRQRIVIEAMFNKVKAADLRTLNQMLDEILPEIETNLQPMEILSLAKNVLQYHIVGTTGFPFKKTTTTMPVYGDCVIPIDLESNVQALHEYLFVGEDYTVSPTVQSISYKIIELTGLDDSAGDIDEESYQTHATS